MLGASLDVPNFGGLRYSRIRRGRFNIPAPAMSGNEEFALFARNSAIRASVQQNTLEQLVIFLRYWKTET